MTKSHLKKKSLSAVNRKGHDYRISGMCAAFLLRKSLQSEYIPGLTLYPQGSRHIETSGIFKYTATVRKRQG
ncbi:MAG TPA: hypothetical protein DCL73_09360 [Treponema sp.]|nr:hypothetical protein [Treponema sp.]